MRVEELLRYHSAESLRRFHDEHQALIKRSVLLMVVPLEQRIDKYKVMDCTKTVYALGGRQYVFLSREDYNAMRRHSKTDLAAFMERHRGCLFKIVASTQQTSIPPDQQPERALAKRKRSDEESTSDSNEMAIELVSRLHEQNTEIRVKLALAEHELERLHAQHEQEKRLLRVELTVEALTKQLKSGSLIASPINLTRTKTQWLQGQQYTQDLSRLVLFNATRWFSNLFQNPELTLERLHAAVQIERVPGAARYKQLRVIVPVTYRYSLRRIVHALAEALGHGGEPYIQTLLEVCPSDYRVVLYGGAAMPDVKHAINCSILALHLHLCKQARMINRKLVDEGENWQVKLCDQELGSVQHLTPTLDLLAHHYPSAVYSGLGTYLLFDMTMPACYMTGGKSSTTSSNKSNKSRRTETQQSPTKGLGTGHGKNCPYCGQLSRTRIQGNNYQKSHQLINCPYIALLSQNEGVILETLRRRSIADTSRSQGKKSNKLAEHDFLVGSNAKKVGQDLEFDFDSQTLFRQAAPEELAAGEHDGGVRINRRRYVRVMRKDVSDTLGTQLYGPLFGQIDQQVQHLLSALYDMEEVDEQGHALPLRQLLYDEFDQKFLEGRYDPQTKKAMRNFDDASDDGLYFTLDSATVRSPVTEYFAQLYHHECLQQQILLSNPPQCMQHQEQFY